MQLVEQFKKTKQEAKALSLCGANKRNAVIERIASLLDSNRSNIKSENLKDLDSAKKENLSQAMIDRLTLLDKHIDSMIKALNEIISQPEVIGEIISGSTRPSGIKILKIRVPLGVVGMIYESRPNVTIDAAALCIKSGNGAILRGGKEALHSNIALAQIIQEALIKERFSKDIIHFITDSNREHIKTMASAKGLIDVIIPRGGEGLIDFVVDNAKIPVIMHNKGVCHIFVEKSANLKNALKIIANAKVQKPSACNALETLLVDSSIAKEFLPQLKEVMDNEGVKILGCERTREIIDVDKAQASDFGREFGDKILALKIIDSIDEAILHINTYGSLHSEAILTQDYEMSERFLEEVDAATVYVNASTRFSDGGEFGLGAEIGISTQKLHARGPMGALDLTTTKYKIYGRGEVRE